MNSDIDAAHLWHDKVRMKNCVQCGNEFEPRRLSVSQKYCSPACGYEGRKAQSREQRSCQNCGTEFEFQKSQLSAYKGAGKFCSRKCSYEGQVQQNKATPSKDRFDRTRRAADLAWQKAVRERDNYTCRRCGHYEKYIHTHHVATRAQRPDLKHDVDNGICLCNGCHSWVHTHPLEAQKLGFLADGRYELERLAVARATMADSRTQFGHLLPVMIELHELGLRPDSIAAKLPCSANSVRKMLRDAGVELHPPGRPRK
jgi:transcription elongation factor Elf1